MSDREFMLIDNNYNIKRRNELLFRILVIGFGVILIFVTITLTISMYSPDIKRPKMVSNCSVSYTYDFSLLTLRWPTTICYNTTSSNDDCVKHDNNKWLIHGLWPTYANQSWPQFCCFDKTFKVKNLEPIIVELKTDWPNLMPNKSFDSLWSHEWAKHGTCTKTKQIDYFNTTLQLYKQFAVIDWLKDSQIVPSNEVTYSLTQFNDVFKAKLGHKVQINCLKNKENGKLLLDQIMICVSHNSSQDIIDCPEESNCKKPFYYPKVY